MTTWDSMSDADYAACIDAGRGPGYDPREVADLKRKEQRENGKTCKVCGAYEGEPHGVSQDPVTMEWSITCEGQYGEGQYD